MRFQHDCIAHMCADHPAPDRLAGGIVGNPPINIGMAARPLWLTSIPIGGFLAWYVGGVALAGEYALQIIRQPRLNLDGHSVLLVSRRKRVLCGRDVVGIAPFPVPALDTNFAAAQVADNFLRPLLALSLLVDKGAGALGLRLHDSSFVAAVHDEPVILGHIRSPLTQGPR